MLVERRRDRVGSFVMLPSLWVGSRCELMASVHVFVQLVDLILPYGEIRSFSPTSELSPTEINIRRKRT